MSYQPFPIQGWKGGLKKNKKPFLLMDDAFQSIENAYVFRDSTIKREGLKLCGRLRRVFSSESAGSFEILAGTNTINLFDQLGLDAVTEPDASISPGDYTTITVAFGAPLSQTFEDSTGTGVMTGFSGDITAVSINYNTWVMTVVSNAGFALSTLTVSLAYYPNLPVVGIEQRHKQSESGNDSVFFDTKYSYTYSGTDFSSPSSRTWNGTSSDIIWSENWRGSDASSRLFFVTNNTAPTGTYDPIYYTSDLVTYTQFEPQLDSTNFLFQCKLIIPYYGRLLALNTWEADISANSKNYYNRCRFSAIGDPTAADAWRSDQFGKGGFIDAPTNEVINSCRFFKNTLIVKFEQTTWQLRYLGEYGLPFIWERISTDFGSTSKRSTVLFDDYVLSIGDKAITSDTTSNVSRIDLDIPDEVFGFQNRNNGRDRIFGEREFQKEIVYFNYVIPNSEGYTRTFPNRVLLFNYRNETWAKFRDNVTALGILRSNPGDSWDSDFSWDSSISWDTVYQDNFPIVVSGNQQGFVHYYNYTADMDSAANNKITLREHESLFVKDITRSNTLSLLLEIPNNNLEEGEVIFLTNCKFVNTSDGSILSDTLNNRFYIISQVVDNNSFYINQWDQEIQEYIGTSYNRIEYTPQPGTGTYMGGGLVALLPKMSIYTKDFNPYQAKGKQLYHSFTDFQTDANPGSNVTINLYTNSDLSYSSNLPVYDTTMNSDLGQNGQILLATQENPCQIFSPNHSLHSGRIIEIENISGMTELNGGIYTVTVLDLDNFTINVNSTGYTAYEFGGDWKTIDQNIFYQSGSRYAWHRYFSNVFGQYITYELTYDDNLMNQIITHVSDFQLNAMTLHLREGGPIVI